MKKAIFLFLAVLLLGFTTVSAKTEDELKEALTKAYTINGVTWQLTSTQINRVNEYLTNNEISSSDADYIYSLIEKAVSIVESGSAKNVSELTKSEKNQLKALATDVSDNTSIKVTVVDGDVHVYNIDGSEFGILDDTGVKYTDSSIMIVAFLISALGVYFIVTKAKKRNA